MHEANGRGAFKNGVRLCRVVVLALTPCTAAGHFTFDALLRTLRCPVQCEEGTEFVLVDAVLDVTNNPSFLVAERVLREAGADVLGIVSIFFMNAPNPARGRKPQ